MPMLAKFSAAYTMSCVSMPPDTSRSEPGVREMAKARTSCVWTRCLSVGTHLRGALQRKEDGRHSASASYNGCVCTTSDAHSS